MANETTTTVTAPAPGAASPATAETAGASRGLANLKRLILSHGARHAAGANHPVELGGDTAWYVEDGTLDVFLQQHAEDVSGRRRLLCTADAGALVWPGGQPDMPPGWRLIAVGHADTKLVSVFGQRLRNVAAGPALTESVEAFVHQVTAGPDAPTRPASNGRNGRNGGAAAAGNAGAAEKSAEPRPAETATRDLRPASLSEARLSAARTAFEETVQDAIRRAVAWDEAESERIGSELTRQHRLLDSALTDLVEVVDRKEVIGVAQEGQIPQLNLALARIGRQLRVEFPEHVGLDEEGDPVAARVAAASCRARVVTLRAGWWSQASTPLLGFLSDSQQPVALIPSRSHYYLYDPATSATTKVDQELARRLAPQAYMIYRPLPDTADTADSLLRSVLPTLGGQLWLLIALASLAGAVTLVIPSVTALIYNTVLPNGDSDVLLAISMLLVGASITWGLIALAQNLTMVRIEGYLETNLDPGLMDRILRLPADFFRRYDTGDLATRAGGLQIIRQQVSGAVVTSVITLVFSLFNIVLLFIYSLVLGAVSLGILTVVVTVLTLLNLRVIRYQHRVFDYTGEIAADLFQALQGVHKMRIAGAEPRVMARWAAGFRRQQRETYAAGAVQAWIYAIIAALPAALALGLYSVAGTLLIGRISTGSFIAVVTALGQFTAALAGVALTIGPLLTVIPLWQRLLPILTEPLEQMGTGEPGTLSGQISLRNVSFSYDPASPPVLHNVTLDVEPGEFVAITGSSGSGKSTLLRLLLGLDHPTSGSVLFDGKDLKSLDARAVRQQFGVVMQGARPLPGEILSTILGDSAGGDAEAWAAAEAAELADDIRRMPMKMHTIIGEGGLAFSGGQVQRMMIARALARRPNLLFFDEATSALDDRAQAEVSQHIDRLHTTRVVIAHRLSTIRNADRVYVMEDGRLVQDGPVADLMAEDGPFKRLAARQLI
jgi:NHLM bacteriocin system ABC transporter ATP-binding protein